MPIEASPRPALAAAPLPLGWSSAVNPVLERTYFVNNSTHAASWEVPEHTTSDTDSTGIQGEHREQGAWLVFRAQRSNRKSIFEQGGASFSPTAIT